MQEKNNPRNERTNIGKTEDIPRYRSSVNTETKTTRTPIKPERQTTINSTQRSINTPVSTAKRSLHEERYNKGKTLNELNRSANRTTYNPNGTTRLGEDKKVGNSLANRSLNQQSSMPRKIEKTENKTKVSLHEARYNRTAVDTKRIERKEITDRSVNSARKSEVFTTRETIKQENLFDKELENRRYEEIEEVENEIEEYEEENRSSGFTFKKAILVGGIVGTILAIPAYIGGYFLRS